MDSRAADGWRMAWKQPLHYGSVARPLNAACKLNVGLQMHNNSSTQAPQGEETAGGS